MCKYEKRKIFSEMWKTIILRHLQGETLNSLAEEFNTCRSSISRLQKHMRECHPKIYDKLEKEAEETQSMDGVFYMQFED